MKHTLLKDFDSPFTIDMNLYPELGWGPFKRLGVDVLSIHA
jgi:hypothetical protein